jgi:hypothetical protein
MEMERLGIYTECVAGSEKVSVLSGFDAKSDLILALRDSTAKGKPLACKFSGL